MIVNSCTMFSWIKKIHIVSDKYRISTIGKNSLNLVQILSFLFFLFLITFLLYYCTYVAVLLFKRDKLTTFIRVDSFH